MCSQKSQEPTEIYTVPDIIYTLTVGVSWASGCNLLIIDLSTSCHLGIIIAQHWQPSILSSLAQHIRLKCRCQYPETTYPNPADTTPIQQTSIIKVGQWSITATLHLCFSTYPRDIPDPQATDIPKSELLSFGRCGDAPGGVLVFQKPHLINGFFRFL